jgi:addiction module HigA family antidote
LIAAPKRHGQTEKYPPGEILLEEFLMPMGISQNALARAISVPPRRINEIVLGKRGITADTGRCACRVHSVPARDSGWACRRITIWKRRAS